MAAGDLNDMWRARRARQIAMPPTRSAASKSTPPPIEASIADLPAARAPDADAPVASTPVAEDAQAPSRPQAGVRLFHALALRAHRLADRFDWLPPEFGYGHVPVDESDARSVIAEWRRCVHQWAAYSPEQVFALKWGLGLFAVALVALWIGVAVIA
jgi:hypothetical protein